MAHGAPDDLPAGFLDPSASRPRGVLAIEAAALNLLLAGLVRWIGVSWSLSQPALAWSFGTVWFLAVLPTQILAAFCKGRASIPAAGAVPVSH